MVRVDYDMPPIIERLSKELRDAMKVCGFSEWASVSMKRGEISHVFLFDGKHSVCAFPEQDGTWSIYLDEEVA